MKQWIHLMSILAGATALSLMPQTALAESLPISRTNNSAPPSEIIPSLLKVASVPHAEGVSAVAKAASTSPSTVLKLGRLQTNGDESTPPAKLYAYDIDGMPATTVYFGGLPIVTFVLGDTSTADTQPMAQARQLTTHLNQLSPAELKQAKITLAVRNGKIATLLNNRPLIQFDDSVRPADGQDTASSALLATNRLRQLLLDAPPLATIEGYTQPQPIATGDGVGVAAEPTIGTQAGLASWYGPGFAGRLAANGEVYDPNLMTAAHLNLPFGTKVEVTNLDNGRSVEVEITDRGPYIRDRIIDLSTAAARTIGLLQQGVGPVQLRILGP